MMTGKKLYTVVLGLLLSVNAMQTLASPAVISPAVYAKLTSTGNQIIPSDKLQEGIPIVMQSINNISGMEWDLVNNRMVIKQAGVYVILSDMQVTAKQNSDIYYWVERNGSPVPESGKQISAKASLASTTFSNSWILPLNEGDSIRFLFSSNQPAVGLTTLPASTAVPNYPTAFIPASPGFTLTMFMLQKPNP